MTKRKKPREFYIIVDCYGLIDAAYRSHEYKTAKRTREWLNEHGPQDRGVYSIIKVREVTRRKRR